MAAITRPSPALPIARLPKTALRARSDEGLVAALRAGHPHAFEAIYDRYHGQILAFCRHMLSSREDGEDAAQQVFVAAYRDLVDSTRDIELRPWLYTIARNRCLSMLRARREAASLEDSAAVSTVGLAETVQRREDLRELVADLGRLPDEQREALVLFELGDLSQTEIGEVLGRDAKQVKALVFQARTTLMGFRDARQIDCGTIREELATARGANLLRGHLRRHLRTCPACKQYADAVKRQRADLALLLPVIPTAGFKAATLAAAGAGGAAGGAAGGGGAGLLAFGAKGFALKAAAGALLAAGAVTTVEVSTHHRHHHHATPPAATAGRSASGGSAAAAGTSTVNVTARQSAALEVARRQSGRLHAGGTEHGSSAPSKRSDPASSSSSSSSSSSTSKSHSHPSTPVKGASRQSTGHGQKSRRGVLPPKARVPLRSTVGKTKAGNAGSGSSSSASADSAGDASTNATTHRQTPTTPAADPSAEATPPVTTPAAP